jgi:cell division transport system ATP-binding protein
MLGLRRKKETTTIDPQQTETPSASPSAVSVSEPEPAPVVVKEEKAKKEVPSPDGLKARRLIKKKEAEPALEVDPSNEPVANRPVLVEFRDLVKKYGHHIVLDHINLKLYRGEFLSLVGPSGAGKSTIIKCLALQEKIDSGRIIVAGRDITLMRPRELPYYRRKVGIVFQDFKLLPSKTVYENVAFALEVSNTPTREIKQRVQLILETVGMQSKRNSFSRELSGGEQQRVAIARALVHDPKILIADEPTGNLDPVNTWEIIDLLFKINKSGTMVILATHDREIVNALKKRVVTMRAGKIVADQEVGTYLV